MNKEKITVLVIAVIGAFMTFMPWAKIGVLLTVNGTDGDGWFTFLVFAVAIAILFIGDKKAELIVWQKNSIIAVGTINFLLAAFEIINIKSKLAQIEQSKDIFGIGKMMAQAVKIQPALYIIALTALLLVVVVVFKKQIFRNFK
ncbi:MAG: hypothetical protein LBT37_05335 [Lactobacillaceae bacterium]|jgi:hypothetical protein|nr:hypothetical protein [Lactobacillaceae bacterium]